jgi:pimeloyl-ACP methyl ester carboxylesterase
MAHDHVTERYALHGMVVSNLRFDVPLAHPRLSGGAPAQDGRTISVFAREVVAAEKQGADLPTLVFFQGGPGGAAPRPETRSGWLGKALEGHRVLLLDQRGTGLSTPVTSETLPVEGDGGAQAAYLAHFRADAIVEDAEAIRRELLGDRPWRALGQSYGGFVALRYLSAAPEGLQAALITGGIPSLTRTAEEVYRATYPRVEAKNHALFTRYPHAQALARRVADHLRGNDVRLPDGEPLTVEQFQLLGIGLGASTGGERLIDLLERALVDVGGYERVSYAFRHGLMAASSFHTSPIYSLLHEAIYAQGRATAWAAQRVRAEFPQFDDAPGRPIRFTGEMVYPWMFEQLAPLRPLRAAAEALAARADWPALYDPDRLADNRVPVSAAVYHDDMYVDVGLSLETAAQVPHVAAWVTNEYEHDGVRADGGRILERLLAKLPVVLG